MSQDLVAVVPPIQTVPPTPAPAAAPAGSLAPGFRFHPTDEELVTYYLRRKACGKPFRFQAVAEIDVYKSEPWELAEFSYLKTRDLEWYFFSPVDRKYGNGSRLNRATGQGYWKATGKDRTVRHQNQVIGMKKTLVFHSGRAPDGKRTNWVMHEYRLVDEALDKAGVSQDGTLKKFCLVVEKDAFVLCRIFQKSGLGPPNGDRYAPFIEEEWDGDGALFIPGGETEEDIANGDEIGVGGNDVEQENVLVNETPLQCEKPTESHNFAIICKRERSEEPEPLSLSQHKRSKHDDPSSSNANGSEDSITTGQDPPQMMMTKSFSPSLLEFPLLAPMGPKENQPPANLLTFDSSNLEKAVPPGYLKFISNLENEVLNASMERETLKIEVMRAEAMINILQSRIEILGKENEDMKRVVRGG